MPTFKLSLAYDGTGFVGWQRQATGVSIQGLLEDALCELEGRSVTVIGAGRTDAGVHALGQVASFSLERVIAPDRLVRALNARLPASVRVLTAEEAPATFHARFAARAKTYRYRIWHSDVISPFERHYAWHVIGAFDVDQVAACARLIEGTHDFAAFQAAGGAARSTERSVASSRIEVSGGQGAGCLIVYEICGNGFLRHMVRNIVGTLAEIGRGRHSPDWMSEVLWSRDRAQAGPTAPPWGLFLISIAYDADAGALAAEP